MKEDFVSFEIAKKLKEKGFDCKTRYGYLPPMPSLLEAFCDTNWSAKNGYSAPTIAQALKWLREEKKIIVTIRYLRAEEGDWDFFAEGINGEIWYCSIISYKNYEESALEGIDYALDYLI